jgi:uncharacterized phage protein gp47/JayE
MATSEYGVTVNGFVRKRLDQIKSDIESNLSAAVGVAISTKPNSVIGQAIGVFVAAIDDLWQVAEDQYNAMYPNTANGVSMSNSVGFAGITRINAQKTKLYEVCYGAPGTVIGSGAQIQGTDSSYYETNQANTISLSNAVSLSITSNGVSNGSTYSVTIDGTTMTKTAGGGDTVNSVLVALTVGSPAGWTASVTNDVLTYTQVDRINGKAVNYSTTLTVVNVGSPVEFYAAETGTLNPAIGTVKSIVTQIAGWTSAINESAAYPGRDLETDTELRQRYSRSVSSQGAAMVEAIQASLINDVVGVAAAIVFENTTDATDSDGRPPHSIEAVIQGGDEGDIANAIWRKKAAGIDTYGSVSVEVTDSQGLPHIIKFNRPTDIPVYLRCILHEDTEVGMSGNAVLESAEYLLTQGNTLSVGQNVILQRLSAYVIRNVEGIGYVELTGSADGVTYTATNINIGVRELATFDAARIEVTAG